MKKNVSGFSLIGFSNQDSINAYLSERLSGTLTYRNSKFPRIKKGEKGAVHKRSYLGSLFCRIILARLGMKNVCIRALTENHAQQIINYDFDVTTLNEQDIINIRSDIADKTRLQYYKELKPYLFWILKKKERIEKDLERIDKNLRKIQVQYEDVLSALEVIDISITNPIPKIFLTRAEILQVGDVLLRYGGKNSLRYYTMWMLSSFTGVRPEEMLDLRFEYFDLNELGEMEVDNNGYGRLYIPKHASKMEVSPSHRLYGTLIVPSVVKVLNAYFRAVYEQTGYLGTGFVFPKLINIPPNTRSIEELKLNTYTPWIQRFSGLFTFLPVKKREHINLKTGRRSMNNLIRNHTALNNPHLNEFDRYSAALIHMRHAGDKDVNTANYTDQLSFDKYLEIVDRALNFPWNQDELDEWEKSMYSYNNSSRIEVLSNLNPTVRENAENVKETLIDLQNQYKQLQQRKPKEMTTREYLKTKRDLEAKIKITEKNQYK